MQEVAVALKMPSKVVEDCRTASLGHVIEDVTGVCTTTAGRAL